MAKRPTLKGNPKQFYVFCTVIGWMGSTKMDSRHRVGQCDTLEEAKAMIDADRIEMASSIRSVFDIETGTAKRYYQIFKAEWAEVLPLGKNHF